MKLAQTIRSLEFREIQKKKENSRKKQENKILACVICLYIYYALQVCEYKKRVPFTSMV